MGEKIEYIRCPRCELNYIDKREKLCKVCQNELQAKGNRELTDEEVKELNLCPVCRTNYLMDDEEICSECAAENDARENNTGMSNDDMSDEKDDREDNWRAYVENDDAEMPEEEFGDMTSITTEEDDILDEGDLGIEDEVEDEELDEEFDEDFDDDDDFDDYSDINFDEEDEDNLDDEEDDDKEDDDEE